MKKQELLNQLAEILLIFVKETAEKDKKTTSVAELTAMTEAAKTLVEIAKVNPL